MPLSFLPLEVALYGTALLWLLLLFPAMVATAYKGRWLYFWVGWLTLGATWIIGAAEDPVRRLRSSGRLLALVAAVLAAIVVLGLFAARPAPLLGLSGGALQASVGGRGFEPCRRLEDRVWVCRRSDRSLSGAVGYRVSVDRVGCWTARMANGTTTRGESELRGCVTLIDYG